jgi:hypothetical protein
MKSTLPVTILKGVKVLEIGLGVASGWCGRLFSDFGAEVYRFDTEKKKDTVGLDGLMLQWLDFGKISSKNKILPNIDVVIVSENEAKNFQLCYPNAVITQNGRDQTLSFKHYQAWYFPMDQKALYQYILAKQRPQSLEVFGLS